MINHNKILGKSRSNEYGTCSSLVRTCTRLFFCNV